MEPKALTFIGRAGDKLDFALREFGVAPDGMTCADFGCNIGGFTDCLLQRGAAKVYAVDTGYGFLDWKLRNDARVVVMERTNALHAELPESMDLIAIDVGWTRQHLILPRALHCLRPGGHVVSLLKPHYEAEKRELRRGALLPELVEEVIARTLDRVREATGLAPAACVESPLAGGKAGNAEYLLHFVKG